MSDHRIKALEALFDEGVNFADYDEGKYRPKPDGYDDETHAVAEVRNRAVKRALDALAPRDDHAMTYLEAVRRAENLEPFTDEELADVRAMPGVTVEVGWRVRQGTILTKIGARDIAALDGSVKHPASRRTSSA